MKKHCESLPSTESHYARENSKLNYFEDSRLTLKNLYCLFLDYYSSITGEEEIPIDISTYSKYFNHYMNFSFRLSPTDVCDVCFSFENDKNDKEVYDDHVARFEQYKVLKKEMLQKKNVLHIEFDFG